jgi:hypothetical protein
LNVKLVGASRNQKVNVQLILQGVLPYIQNVSGDSFVTNSQIRLLTIPVLLIVGSFKDASFE